MKKSEEIKKSSLYKIYDDRGETYTGSKSEILNVVENALEGMASPIAGRNPLTLTFEWDWVDDGKEASTKKSKIKKTPIINLYGRDDEETREEIEFYNSGADVTAEEISALAPSAEVIVDLGHIDVVWRLPSGNHPGLWITTHGKGRQGVHVTAYHFDYPDEEGVSGFLQQMVDKYSRKSTDLINSGSGLPAEEIKEAVREMELELGRYAMATRMPIYNGSTKKSTKKSYAPNYLGFSDMVSKMRNTRDNQRIFKE